MLKSYDRNADKELIYGNSEYKFTDVARNWMYEPIKQLATNEMVNGYGDGLYRPNQKITRAEAVEMISKTFGRSESWNGSVGFKDVLQNHWAYKKIMNAANGQ